MTYSSMPESSDFHSFFVFCKLAFPQEELLRFQQVGGYKESDPGLKRGSWCSFIPPPSSSFPSLLLHGTAAAAALHTEKRAQPERCCFWDSSRPCSMSKMEEREKFRKSIFQPHAASFLQLSLNLCLFYVTFVLAACLI